MALLDDPENKKKLNRLLIEWAPLINRHATSLKKRFEDAGVQGIDIDDLRHAGIHGLAEAWVNFDPKKAVSREGQTEENPLMRYAHSRIRGRMLDHIDSLHAVPKVIREEVRRREKSAHQASAAPVKEFTPAEPQSATSSSEPNASEMPKEEPPKIKTP